jgi:hypothetical protein
MNNKIRVKHKKLGMTGYICFTSGKWSFVCWDGWNIAIPYSPEWLEKIEEEGEHGQPNSNQAADGL